MANGAPSMDRLGNRLSLQGVLIESPQMIACIVHGRAA